MLGKIIGTAFLLIHGLGFVGFGIFGLVNLNSNVTVWGSNFNFENSLWQLLAVIGAGASLCYLGFSVWRRSK